MNQDKVLARRIKSAREALGLSQGRLGEYLGIDQPAVSKIENGTTEVGALRLVKIADILGRPVNWFLGLETELTDDEAELLHNYRRIASEDIRRFILTAAREAPKRD